MSSPADAHRTLCEAVDDPYRFARRWQDDGGVLVGYVGDDLPLELVDAVGALPVRLVARPETNRREAGELLSGAVDPAAVAVLGDLLDGVIAPDLVLISHESDASLQLFYTLRELGRIGRKPAGVEIALVDVLHARRRTTTAYVTEQVRMLTGRLEVLASTTVTPERLAVTIADRHRLRDELALVADRQRAGRLAGATALRYRLAAAALPAATAVELLRDARAAAPGEPSGAPLLLTGSGHDTPHLYDELADRGWNVTVDEASSAAGAPAASVAALALHCQVERGGPNAAPVDERVQRLAAGASGAGVAAHLAYVRRGDDGLRWDVPVLASALSVPTALVHGQDLGGLRLDDRARDLLEMHV